MAIAFSEHDITSDHSVTCFSLLLSLHLQLVHRTFVSMFQSNLRPQPEVSAGISGLNSRLIRRVAANRVP